MNLREVTIGRANTSDIYLDSRCQYASGKHAVIYYDGGQLMYKDTSTNGTMINNVNVHKRAIPINRGDVIMIAGKYPLSWNQIDSFFPNSMPNRPIGTIIAPPIPNPTPATPVQPDLQKWNWGAFFLSGLWGLFNGCWWLFLLNMIPIVTPIVNIIAGVKGNEWAWYNRRWNSVQEFNDTQSSWAKAGVILFSVSMLFLFIYIMMIVSLLF